MTDSKPTSPIHVVAIGASAGGLEALEKLFDHMACDTGATFVVIQHLSPDYKSMMANLLSRHTQMPVVMVQQDTPIQPNHVYLIPPGSMMHIGEGYLRLTPKNPRTLTLPIDVFFKSMAEHYGERSVGIILSGTGSDGTRGAAAINDAGGFLMAQEPEDAKFDGMPRSVIATGLVDVILPVDQMGPRILDLLRSQPTARATAARAVPGREAALSPEAAMTGIMQLLLKIGGIDFQEYKPGTVTRRIERRMTVRQCATLASYLELLTDDRNEVLTLRRELLIPVTSFFRDAEAFEILARQIIEPLVLKKQTGDTLRVWAAAVSTGEEAYSLAMLFLEAFDQLKRWPTLKIFATDVEQHNVETAGSGSYPESIAAEVSPQQLERFFVKKGNNFCVKNELRQCIVFARHNMLTDPPFTRMDLVVCRNALIYFKAQAQERALKRFQYALLPGGHLFLGSSESLSELDKDFTPISGRHKIWQLVRTTRMPLEIANSAGSGYGYSGSVRGAGQKAHASRLKSTAVDLGFNALLKAFSPPAAVLVNSRHELVHSYGEVHKFLQLRAGSASLDLNRILPDPLIPVAVALLFKAGREACSVSSDRLKIDAQGQVEHLRLSAWPVEEFEGERLTLLAFEQLRAPAPSETLTSVDLSNETAERIEVLERELAATRESLQATVEELETSNEELQATNEELMASNEELQSANEELQSVNEELITVNAEFQEKIDILNRLNADLDNMAQAVPAGTVFVDEFLKLTRFSPDATHIFKLRDSDIGRPLDDLAHTLIYPDLIADLGHTLKEGVKVEKEVRGVNGLHYLVRMLPYSASSSSARGAVTSFLDVTALHEISRLQHIIDALAEHIAVLNPQGIITLTNAAWRRFAIDNGDKDLRYSGPGVNYLDVCREITDPHDAHLPHNSTASAAQQGVRDVLEGRRTLFSLEYPCHSPTQERWFVMHVSKVGGEQPGAVISHVNISEWREQRTPIQP